MSEGRGKSMDPLEVVEMMGRSARIFEESGNWEQAAIVLRGVLAFLEDEPSKGTAHHRVVALSLAEAYLELEQYEEARPWIDVVWQGLADADELTGVPAVRTFLAGATLAAVERQWDREGELRSNAWRLLAQHTDGFDPAIERALRRHVRCLDCAGRSSAAREMSDLADWASTKMRGRA